MQEARHLWLIGAALLGLALYACTGAPSEPERSENAVADARPASSSEATLRTESSAPVGEDEKAEPQLNPPGERTLRFAQVPFRIVSIDLGRAIDANNAITDKATRFAPHDPIYASIASEGVGEQIKISARWTDEKGEVVAEHIETVSPTGAARIEMHVEHPTGWPKGGYKLELAMDGKPLATREFRVE
jgi:hypothetical protein